MKRNLILSILVGVLFSVVYFGNSFLWAAENKKTEEEKPKKIDPSQFEFFQDVQSLADLVEEDTDVTLEDDRVDEDVKVVYRVPETCKEFSVYLQAKQKKLIKLEKEIQKKQRMLAKLKEEFEEVTAKYSKVETRIKKLIHRDPTNLDDNPELAKMIKLYEGFSAEDAAARLKNLDLDLTLALMKGMNPKKLGGILAVMEPKLAAALSSQIVRGF